jgi:hypothetical protein
MVIFPVPPFCWATVLMRPAMGITPEADCCTALLSKGCHKSCKGVVQAGAPLGRSFPRPPYLHRISIGATNKRRDW